MVHCMQARSEAFDVWVSQLAEKKRLTRNQVNSLIREIHLICIVLYKELQITHSCVSLNQHES